MASSGSGGGGGGGGRLSSPPAAAPRAVVDNLIDVRARAEILRNMLQGSPTPPGTPAETAPAGTSELIDGIMSSLSSALSALDTPGGGGGGQGQGRRRRRAGAVAGSGPQRRNMSTRRRSHSPFLKTVTTSTLDDGNSWRKYGQKHIQDSPNARSYYRCTHKPDQGCRATRQVQTSDDNPSEFVISYFGHHTCRDPSTMPLVIHDDTAPPDSANLISFGSTAAMGASTSTHNITVPPPHAFDPTTMLVSRFVYRYSSSLPAQDHRCGSEEVHSSSSPAGDLTAVVGSAGMASSATVGSAPAEYMACGAGGTGSFPSSPSSLGFMTGSFGSFGNAGDDDLFGFDP
ncbi:hypothetical protein SETIT_2G433600v2 [Setaria italica]|uniref:WRKY domain-containing protein n=1 Tax=Setaria italica TaxID=4555 RepID=K3ZUW4_SETIT|nr:probable WRKY transcription factor 38 [Setaria italica]RCV14529.1 hypothetical protein SETIT_2G433600v2 [Setaria italica]